MTCQHKHHTAVRAHLEDGDTIAIHQCDDCGLALPAIPTDDDPFTLPVFDEKAAARSYTRQWEKVLGEDNHNAINYAKGVKYVQPYVR